MMRSTRKPPLALRSPIRLRSRRPVSVQSSQTPSGTSTKAGVPKQSSILEEPELRPEYQTISCELKALTKMVQDNLCGSATTTQSANGYDASPLFQRGRLYDEYSARRNERLKRKRGGESSVVEKMTPCKQFLGVRIESAKRTSEVKKFETARKVTTTPLVERRLVTTTTQRYSLRSSFKENKKPPLAMSFEKSMGATPEKKTAVRSTRKGH